MDTKDEMLQARRAAVTGMKPNGGLPDGLARYRRDHPQRTSSWRVDKTGGWVFMYAATAYYFGPCRNCTNRVQTQRKETKDTRGLGRWPEVCNDCREASCEDPNGTEARRQVRKSRNPHHHDMRQYNNHPEPSLRN